MKKIIANILNVIHYTINQIHSLVSYNSSLPDKIIIILIAFIAIFFCISILFSIITLILRLQNYLKARKWQNFENKWEKDLLDVLSESMTPQELIDKIEKQHQLYFLDYLFRFALRIKGRELSILSEIANHFKDALIARLKTGDKTQKIRAIITLDKLQIHDIETHYLKLLNDPSPLVSLYAARTLAKQNNPDYLNKIIRKFPEYKTWSNQILANLLTTAGSEHTPLYRDKFADDSLPAFSRTIIGKALLHLNDIRAADVASNILQSVVDPELIITCLQIIANTGAPRHRKTVKKFINSDNTTIRASAIQALGTIGIEEDREAIETAFLQDSNFVSYHAALALQQIKAFESLEKFSKLENQKSQIAINIIQN